MLRNSSIEVVNIVVPIPGGVGAGTKLSHLEILRASPPLGKLRLPVVVVVVTAIGIG